MTLSPRLSSFLPHCSRQLHESCAGMNMKKLWAEQVLICTQYLALKSHTALHEAFRNEVPGKTKQQLTLNGEIQKMFWVRNMSDIRQQWQVRLSTSMMKHYSIITEICETVVNFTPIHFTPKGKNLVPTYYKVGCTPEQVWTFWRRKESLVPNGNQALDHAACNLVHQAINYNCDLTYFKQHINCNNSILPLIS